MKLAIFGSGGHGRVVADAAEASGQWSQIVFFDGKWPDLARSGVWDVAGGLDELIASLDDHDGVIVAIGNNAVRVQLQQQLQQAGAKLATILHPQAVISRHASVGRGSVVFAGAVINIGASVAEACIINTGATIDHDCVLHHGVHVSPGAHLAGATTVGARSWIGIGACSRQLVAIGADVMVGAGAVVVKDVPDSVTIVGNPAKPLQA